MGGEGRSARGGEARVSTGNPSLDRMLEGGLVARRPYLIVGPSGTGKTTLALQFLCEGARRGERALLVTLEEPPNEARVNHRGLSPELERVDVFDAIPDIMRYERTPFKDIASVRSAVPFREVPLEIRRSPELASVEVTITALEQMLRSEVIRRGYTRLVIDSLTALQYFCMKGFDPVAGAQSFLRFLSDLRVTTLLTVESPLEDIETPERMLARGEIRLFRWELDGVTVRAVGVEKFRGSSHDVRLHPYRIGPKGIDINLDVTISRDTRQIIEPLVRAPAPPSVPAGIAPLVSPVTPLVDEVRDLILLGADVTPARQEIEDALGAAKEGRLEAAQSHLSRVSSLVIRLVDTLDRGPHPSASGDPTATAAFQRVLARADSVRTGVPPTSLPEPAVLTVQLGALLSLLPPPPSPVHVEAPTPEPVVESAPPTLIPAPVPEPVIVVPEVVAPEPDSPAPPAPVAPVPEAVPPPPPPPPPPPEPDVPVLDVTEVPEASEPAPVAEEVPPPPKPPAPAEAVPSPAPVRTVVPEPVTTAPPRSPPPAKVLPAPPKPRTTVVAPKLPAPSGASAPSGAPATSTPPPLPSTSVPEWPGTSRVGASETLPAGTAPAPAPHVSPRTAAPPAKKRKKASGAPTGHKRAAAAARPPPSPVPPSFPEVATAPGAAAAAPPTPTVAETVPKPRRKTTRKRKAPPVVSAEVEPIPPGVFGRDAGDVEPNDSSDAAPPEG